MDGIELGREVARLRAAGRAEARLGMLRRSRPEPNTATAADCVATVREPLLRLEPLRRQPGPTGMRWPAPPVVFPV